MKITEDIIKELTFRDRIIIKFSLINYKKDKREMLRIMKGFPVSEEIHIEEITRIRHLIKML